MKTYAVTVDFYAGNKKVHDRTYYITEDTEERAACFVENFLHMEEFNNFKVVGVKAVST